GNAVGALKDRKRKGCCEHTQGTLAPIGNGWCRGPRSPTDRQGLTRKAGGIARPWSLDSLKGYSDFAFLYTARMRGDCCVPPLVENSLGRFAPAMVWQICNLSPSNL